MSEFKFACPVCGQHITADSSTSGSQLECPTCFRKIVVPQAPSTSASKFILAASEVNKPRPSTSTPPLNPTSKSAPKRGVPAAVVALIALIAIGAAGATLYALRGKLFDKNKSVAKDGTSQSESNEELAQVESGR